MITKERLAELLSYHPETGNFRWVKTTTHRVKPGMVAGVVASNGYRYIGIDGKRYLAHRLAWLYMTGKQPPQVIDHANCDSLDNRWTNLRAANQTLNLGNTAAHKNNKSGVKGVCYDPVKKRWKAQITRGGKNTFIGRYITIEEAQAAYARAAVEVFGEFARMA